MRKELWGQVRTIVITRSEKLLAGQIAGIRAALGKKQTTLHELRHQLLQSQRPKARGKGYTRESLQKRLDALTSGQYTAEILKTEILAAPGRLDFTFRPPDVYPV